jgi:aspartate carbamoyltransferase regulatory subunit
MIVDRIENGIVIDHMEPGRSLIVIDLLNLTGREFLHQKKIIAIAMNVRSGKQTHKDVLKISNFSLTDEMIENLGLIIPKATLNIIENFEVVEKKEFTLPKEISGLTCPSGACITNYRENVVTNFYVIAQKQKSDTIEEFQLRCKFCDQQFPITQFLENWKIDWS